MTDCEKINVELNTPPFLDGLQQLPADEVKHGTQIASLYIHVERAVGRINQFAIREGNVLVIPVCLLQHCSSTDLPPSPIL